MLERNVRLGNKLGLHARAAAQIVHLARTFESDITVKRLDNNKVADARSILGLLALSASRGVDLLIVAEGPDAAQAIEEIDSLFTNSFGEDQTPS